MSPMEETYWLIEVQKGGEATVIGAFPSEEEQAEEAKRIMSASGNNVLWLNVEDGTPYVGRYY